MADDVGTENDIPSETLARTKRRCDVIPTVTTKEKGCQNASSVPHLYKNLDTEHELSTKRYTRLEMLTWTNAEIGARNFMALTTRIIQERKTFDVIKDVKIGSPCLTLTRLRG
jgi:hypothetical protein